MDIENFKDFITGKRYDSMKLWDFVMKTGYFKKNMLFDIIGKSKYIVRTKRTFIIKNYVKFIKYVCQNPKCISNHVMMYISDNIHYNNLDVHEIKDITFIKHPINVGMQVVKNEKISNDAYFDIVTTFLKYNTFIYSFSKVNSVETIQNKTNLTITGHIFEMDYRSALLPLIPFIFPIINIITNYRIKINLYTYILSLNPVYIKASIFINICKHYNHISIYGKPVITELIFNNNQVVENIKLIGFTGLKKIVLLNPANNNIIIENGSKDINVFSSSNFVESFEKSTTLYFNNNKKIVINQQCKYIQCNGFIF